MVEWEWEGQLLKYYDGGEAELAKILADFGHTDSRVLVIRRHEVEGDRGIWHAPSTKPQPIGFQGPA